MKAKTLTGFILALVLGACPSLSAFASAGSRRGAHSCCSAGEAGKNRLPPSPAQGDCCLRAPAHSAALVVAPVFQVVMIFATRQPPGRTEGLFAEDSSDSSPPFDDPAVRGSSPRAPPVPA
jgi:hypothetical protein